VAFLKNFKENVVVWAYGLWSEEKYDEKNRVEKDKRRYNDDGWDVGREMEDRHFNRVRRLDVFYGTQSRDLGNVTCPFLGSMNLHLGDIRANVQDNKVFHDVSGSR